MRTEYANIIFDIIEKRIDVKSLALAIEKCDPQQVHKLVWMLKSTQNEYDYITDDCKDPTIREVLQLNISDRIERIKKQIEEL